MGTFCLQHSQGFSKPIPTIVVHAAYSTSRLFLSRVVQSILLSIIHTQWSGIGFENLTGNHP